MADLLECLLQIKALGTSAARLDALARAAGGQTPDARERVRRVAADLADAERRWHAALAAALPEAAGLLGSARAAPADAEFSELRRASLDVLDRCSAAQLAAPATLDGRAPGLVADVVASMLAHDIECLGALRATLDQASPPAAPAPAGPVTAGAEGAPGRRYTDVTHHG